MTNKLTTTTVIKRINPAAAKVSMFIKGLEMSNPGNSY